MGISVNGLNYSERVRYKPKIDISGWDKIPHKGMSTLPRDELIDKIKQLAQKSADEKLSDQEYNALCAQREQLWAQYVSPASPDRVSLLKNAETTIRNHQNAKAGESELFNKTLLDYLNEKDGFIKTNHRMVNGKAYPMPGGGNVTAIATGVGGVSYNVEYGGEVVLTFNNPVGSFTPVLTSAETQLSKDFYRIYFDAVDHVKAAKRQEKLSPNDHLDRKV